MYETFIDLDELILRCRDKLSRNFIQEAVSCYRAGAFRSCIVATWNAVVFDFLHKLRELELFGDKEAKRLLEEFDNLISSSSQVKKPKESDNLISSDSQVTRSKKSDNLKVSSDKYKKLWEFESNIPEVALTKFELISSVEQSDIKRLFEDRSRCAHPSMTSLEEPFEATAELARYHLRSAVTHLLARPPVQGRAAKKRIWQDIESKFFPKDTESAITHFQNGPLAHARLTLVKDIVIGLTKDLLLEERSEDEKSRQFSALNAVSSMYFKETTEILNDKLSEIILNNVTDEKWDKTIIYLGSMTNSYFLSEPCILKAKSYLDKIEIYQKNTRFKYSSKMELSENAISILIKASRVDFLREIVDQKLEKISVDDLLFIKNKHWNCDFFKDEIIIPILRRLSSQATLELDELLSLIADSSFSSDENIKFNIEKKIKDSSLTELISTTSLDLDQWVLDLIETELEVKIPIAASENSFSSNQNLKNLLKLKLAYKEDKPKKNIKRNIINLFDKSIKEELEKVSFNDLSFPKEEYEKYWDEINEEALKFFLKNNALNLINKFANSPSFVLAGTHSMLLVKIAEYLTPEQWKNILESFCKNNQLYDSWSCCAQFQELFNKFCELSNELRDDIQPYWLTFRDKLKELNIPNTETLKQLIDDYRADTRNSDPTAQTVR